MSRFLVIQLKRIGDFILTAPAVQALRAARPDSEIVLLVSAALSGLAACVPGVNRVIVYQPGKANLETWASAIAGEWEAALDFTGTDRSALVTTLSRANHRVGYAKFAGSGLRRLAYTALSMASVRELHTVDFHLHLVGTYLGVPVTPPEAPALVVPAEVKARVTKNLRAAGVTEAFAIIHPGTAREEKFWQDDRWADVAEFLHSDHSLKVVITGSGEGLEKPHLQALHARLRTPAVDLTGQLSLVEMIALIEASMLIVGVDSMAMHLAALLRKPQVALFGPTNPYHWRARHERSVVLTPWQVSPQRVFKAKTKKGEMAGISTAMVRQALGSLIS